MKRAFFAGFALIVSLGLSALLAADPLKVVSPGEKVDGKTMAEHAADWWKWSQSVPDDRDPVKDDNGRFCDVGQSGAVWFLVGTYDRSHVSRTCEVPAGKHVFFPVINSVAWKGPQSEMTCAEAKRSAASQIQDGLDLFVELDGAPLSRVKRYRAASDECFNLYERVEEERGARDGYPAATDGFWIMLEPPSPGEHHLRFGGRQTKGERPGVIQDNEYTLTIR